MHLSTGVLGVQKKTGSPGAGFTGGCKLFTVGTEARALVRAVVSLGC